MHKITISTNRSVTEEAEKQPPKKKVETRMNRSTLKKGLSPKSLNAKNGNSSAARDDDNYIPYFITPVLFYQNEATHKTQKSTDNMFTTFTQIVRENTDLLRPFEEYKMMDRFRSDVPLDVHLRLKHNTNERKKFVEVFESERKITYDQLLNRVSEREKMLKYMRKVKIHDKNSSSIQMSSNFDGDLRDDDFAERTEKKIANMYSSAFMKNFKFYWYNIEQDTYKPANREGATFTLIGTKGYLYGGRSRALQEEMDVLDTSN
jgi:hypothetical protein